MAGPSADQKPYPWPGRGQCGGPLRPRRRKRRDLACRARRCGPAGVPRPYGRIPASRRWHRRHARGLCRAARRCRDPAPDISQQLGPGPRDRGDQRGRSRAGAARGPRATPGLQPPFRRSELPARGARASFHPPSTTAARPAAGPAALHPRRRQDAPGRRL